MLLMFAIMISTCYGSNAKAYRQDMEKAFIHVYENLNSDVPYFGDFQEELDLPYTEIAAKNGIVNILGTSSKDSMPDDFLIYSGVLKKRGERFHTWKNTWTNRYVELQKNGSFKYYEDAAKTTLKGDGTLSGVTRWYYEDKDSTLVFAFDAPEKRDWFFRFANKEEENVWKNYVENGSEFIQPSGSTNKESMDWFHNLDQEPKDDVLQLLSQYIQEYGWNINEDNEDVVKGMEEIFGNFGIHPSQTQQLYEFFYLEKKENKNSPEKQIGKRLMDLHGSSPTDTDGDNIPEIDLMWIVHNTNMSTEYSGVYESRGGETAWGAYLKIDDKHKFLGTWKTEKEAALRVNQEREKRHMELKNPIGVCYPDKVYGTDAFQQRIESLKDCAKLETWYSNSEINYEGYMEQIEQFHWERFLRTERDYPGTTKSEEKLKISLVALKTFMEYKFLREDPMVRYNKALFKNLEEENDFLEAMKKIVPLQIYGKDREGQPVVYVDGTNDEEVWNQLKDLINEKTIEEPELGLKKLIYYKYRKVLRFIPNRYLLITDATEATNELNILKERLPTIKKLHDAKKIRIGYENSKS